MKKVELDTKIEGLLAFQPNVYKDHRGYFLETFNSDRYKEFGLDVQFVQDNISSSQPNVLRGLHMQKEHPQGKLVSVLEGRVWDVAVDLRPNSPTFKQWFGLFLDGELKTQFYIPPGFAHGFVVVGDQPALFHYKCTDKYYGDDQVCLLWNDVDLNIKWPVATPLLSEQDAKAKLLKEYLS